MFEEQQEGKESFGKVMQVRVEGNDEFVFLLQVEWEANGGFQARRLQDLVFILKIFPLSSV